jgi:hypothetical protein
MIPTKLHAVVDYLFGIVAMLAPWLLGFNQLTTPTALLVTVGALTMVMSLFTNYEGGVLKIIPMRIHLVLDLLIGIVLSLSPWLFNFSHVIKYPHLAMGIFAIIASLITKKFP